MVTVSDSIRVSKIIQHEDSFQLCGSLQGLSPYMRSDVVGAREVS